MGRDPAVPCRAHPRAGPPPDADAGRATSTRSPARSRADVIFLDPALPLGLLGSRVSAAPWVVVLHGAEVTVPGRLPGSRQALRRVLRDAAGVVAAGAYPAREAVRAAGAELGGLVIPPGVDVERFTRPASRDQVRAERVAARAGARIARRSSRSAGSCRARGSTCCWTRFRSWRWTSSSRSRVTAATGSVSRPRAPARPRRSRPVPRPGARRDVAGGVPVRRRVRDDVPRAVGWARGGRVRHRVPRSGCVRGARDRGSQRWLPRGGGRRRDRVRHRPGRRDAALPDPRTTADRSGAADPHGRRGADVGRRVLLRRARRASSRRWPPAT